MNAGIFEKYALDKINSIFEQNNVAVMVGGTGLYVNALCDGIDVMPNIPIAIRKKIVETYNEKGLAWLQQEIEKKDNLFWQNAEQQNPQRLMRALEVVEATGKSINSFKQQAKVERDFNIVRVGLELTKDKLHNNINRRVDMMIEQGQVQEAASLQHYKHLNALQTVGYKELFEHFDGNINLHQAIDKIKISTRQYAKRQMTWFKKDTSIKWLNASETIDLTSLQHQ